MLVPHRDLRERDALRWAGTPIFHGEMYRTGNVDRERLAVIKGNGESHRIPHDGFYESTGGYSHHPPVLAWVLRSFPPRRGRFGCGVVEDFAGQGKRRIVEGKVLPKSPGRSIDDAGQGVDTCGEISEGAENIA